MVVKESTIVQALEEARRLLSWAIDYAGLSTEAEEGFSDALVLVRRALEETSYCGEGRTGRSMTTTLWATSLAEKIAFGLAKQMDWDIACMSDSVYIAHQCPDCTHPPYRYLGNLKRHYCAKHP